MILRMVYQIMILILLGSVGTASARDCLSVGAGEGTRGLRGYRAGWEHSWPTLMTHKNQRFTGYWDLAYTDVTSNETFNEPSNDHTVIISVSPVFRIPFKLFFPAFIDAGIGLAHSSAKLIANRDLGSVWVFEDRLGAGVFLGARQSLEVGYRFLHYSNAYLAQKNQGLNLHFIIVGYWFN